MTLFIKECSRTEIPRLRGKSKTTIQLEAILKDVCDSLGFEVDEIKSKSRKREKCFARNIYCYVAKIKTKYSHREIAELIGGRDHTTCIHSINTFKDSMDTRDPGFMADWEAYLKYSQLFTEKDFQ